MFYSEFSEIFKKNFFTEHLRTTTPVPSPLNPLQANTLILNLSENTRKDQFRRDQFNSEVAAESALRRCSFGKRLVKICSKFTGEHSCQSVISIKLQSNFIEIVLQRGCSVNLLRIFRIHFTITPLEGCFYSHRKSSIKSGVHKDFAKLTGKHQCLNLFFNKIAGLRTANLLKKRLRHRCFSDNFVEFLRTQFCRALQADCFCQWCVLLSISFMFRAFTFED